VFAYGFPRRLALASVSFGGVLWLVTGGAAGCGDDPETFVLSNATATSGSGGASSSSGSNGVGGAGAGVTVGEAMFNDLKEDLVAACADCHKTGGVADTPFMGNPDNGVPDPYESITSWPGAIVKDPNTSVLITWPGSGLHSNGATDAALETRILAWLAEEAKSLPDVSDPNVVPPFKPIVPGFNAVYLDTVDPQYEGMAITFLADQLTDTELELKNLRVNPTLEKGVHMDHPVWHVLPAGSATGTPDPDDTFAAVLQDFDPGQSGPLGTGQVVFSHWEPKAKLSIVFDELSIIDPGAGGAGGGGPACNALMEFQNSAQTPLQNNCADACHGGNNNAATSAFDMSDLANDTASTCSVVLQRVDTADPPGSQIFLNTDPNGNANHPFKFGGDATAHGNFVTAVTPWIQAE
jgi:hypothetical protein